MEGLSRSVLVLGGSSPIGGAICTRFRREGDRVVSISKELRSELSGIEQIVEDCSEPVRANAAVGRAIAALGGLEVLVLAAARMPVASVVETSDEQWAGALADGLTSAFYVLRSSLRQMASGGSIVAVGSVNSFLVAPALAAYSAAKGGLDALIRQVALDYGSRGIRANIVAPAFVASDPTPEQRAGYPLGRTPGPGDVAAAVWFLASADASLITGVTLPVDGGLSTASPAAFLRRDLRERFPS